MMHDHPKPYGIAIRSAAFTSIFLLIFFLFNRTTGYQAHISTYFVSAGVFFLVFLAVGAVVGRHKKQ